MASYATPREERDAQLISVGTQCSAPSCLLIDFLPFKCQHCKKPYCAEHFTVDGHSCDQYDEHKHNRVAPSCPFCNEPITIPTGQDPNIRMELHIEKECSVTTGREKKKSTPTCAHKKCSKVLFAPIKCDKCNKQFCPSHRFPSDHTCSALSASASTGPSSTSLASSSRPAPPPRNYDRFNLAKPSALKQKVTAAVAPKPAPTPTPTKLSPNKNNSSTSSSTKATTSISKPSGLPGPFNKTDRRAKAERESRRKAMAERAKKGLLSEEEKAILAQEEAEAKDNKDCVVM